VIKIKLSDILAQSVAKRKEGVIPHSSWVGSDLKFFLLGYLAGTERKKIKGVLSGEKPKEIADKCPCLTCIIKGNC